MSVPPKMEKAGMSRSFGDLLCGLGKSPHKSSTTPKFRDKKGNHLLNSIGENDSGFTSEAPSANHSRKSVSVNSLLEAKPSGHVSGDASMLMAAAALPSVTTHVEAAASSVPQQYQGSNEELNIAKNLTFQREDNSSMQDETALHVNTNALVPTDGMSSDGNDSISEFIKTQQSVDPPITDQTTSRNAEGLTGNGAGLEQLVPREDNSEGSSNKTVDYNKDQGANTKKFEKPIPCYDSVVASADRDTESGYGSIDININVEVFQLQTKLASGERFPAIPDEVISFVENLCDEYDVKVARVQQSLHDCKVFSLQGVDVEGVKDTFETAVRDKFPAFTMTVEEIDDVREMTNEFDGPHAFQNSFKLIKTARQPQKNKSTVVKESTCEMVLEGMNVNRNHVALPSKFVMVPAHSVIEEEDCKDLLAEDAPANAIELKRAEVLSRGYNTQYYIQQHNPNRLLSLERSSLNFAYRHFRRDDDCSLPPYSHFLADVALLEINSQELNYSGGKVISFPDLEEKMRLNIDGKQIRALLPLREKQDLELMRSARVRVKVGGRFGYMINPIKQVGKKKKRQQLLHISFITEDGPLYSGQSGSVVYVINAKTGEYYQVGMLIGELFATCTGEETRIYQAVVLRQALDELEVVHRKYVKELYPLCQDYVNDGHVQRLIRDLEIASRQPSIEHRSRTVPEQSTRRLDSGMGESNSMRTADDSGFDLDELKSSTQ